MDKLKGLRIATRHASIGELVEKMHRCCDGSSLFVATRDPRQVGAVGPFALELADRTVALRGWCVVLDAWTTADNPYRQPGVRLGLSRLTPESCEVLELMRVRRASEMASPLDLGGPTDRRAPADLDLTIAERRPRQSTQRSPAGQLRPPARATPRPAPVAPQRATGMELAAERALPLLRPMPPLPRAAAPEPTRLLPAGRALELAGARRRRPSPQVVLPANPLRDLSDATVGNLVGGLGRGSDSDWLDPPDAVWDVRGTGRDEEADADESWCGGEGGGEGGGPSDGPSDGIEDDDSAFEVLDAFDAPSIRKREPSWAPPTAVGTPAAAVRARAAEAAAAAAVTADPPDLAAEVDAAVSALVVEANVPAAATTADTNAPSATAAEADAAPDAAPDAALEAADVASAPARASALAIRWHVVLATVISCLGIAAAIRLAL